VNGRVLHILKLSGTAGAVNLLLPESGQQVIQVSIYGSDYRVVKQVL
jgi:hypothetical protein